MVVLDGLNPNYLSTQNGEVLSIPRLTHELCVVNRLLRHQLFRSYKSPKILRIRRENAPESDRYNTS
jgi:hypothetical protein